MAEVTGAAIRIDFGLLPEDKQAARPGTTIPAKPSAVVQRQQMAERVEHPMVRKATDLFGARIVRVEEPNA